MLSSAPGKACTPRNTVFRDRVGKYGSTVWRWYPPAASNTKLTSIRFRITARDCSGGFANSAWLAELDVQFARLYLDAVKSILSGGPAAGCWQILFVKRSQTPIARVQFALAGINAHINHDLPEAVVSTCQATSTTPLHGSTQYDDYTAVNTTLDGIIQSAIKTLHVRLLGDALPLVSHLEETLAAWSTGAARESAWNNAELLWHLLDAPPLSANFMDSLDGLTTVAGKALLV